ncbi:MAG: hypothetical protein AUH10_00095 [Gammaproteobacteria bacterium 13_2_20CM_66_19]|nr:MAG: hypothetical protein AUH10_00095 [Gammaproteobacteria bacterium 13_2_20CM_66_19]
MEFEGQQKALLLKARLAASEKSIVTLQFWLGERPLSVTSFWRQGPLLIRPAIATAVLNLAANDRLILSPYSAPDHHRTINGRDISLSAQQVIYLDYVLTGRTRDHALLDRNWRGHSLSRIAVELSAQESFEVISTWFDTYSFRGFVTPLASPVDLEVLADIQMEPVEPFDPVRLPEGVSWFEDADDGCALRIHSAAWTVDEIERRLRLPELDAVLAKVPLAASN